MSGRTVHIEKEEPVKVEEPVKQADTNETIVSPIEGNFYQLQKYLIKYFQEK